MKKKKQFISFLLILAAIGAAWYLMQYFCAYVVLSGSMEPAIPTGSIVVVNSQKKDWKPGEVITYRRGTILVTHRIQKKTEEGYVTRGDANQEEDVGTVSEKQIKGNVVIVLPWLGYGIVWLQQRRKLFFPLLGVAMVSVLVHMLHGKKLPEQQNEKENRRIS